MRQCRKCNVEKPLEDFPVRNTGHRRYECHECNAKWQSQYRKNNREHIRYTRASALYGISYDDAKVLYEGACHICHEKPAETLHIDHCHKTDVVRGALCTHCNNGIARFKDDITLLERAIKYLK